MYSVSKANIIGYKLLQQGLEFVIWRAGTGTILTTLSIIKIIPYVTGNMAVILCEDIRTLNKSSSCWVCKWNLQTKYQDSVNCI
jgi:hypothetical protein